MEWPHWMYGAQEPPPLQAPSLVLLPFSSPAPPPEESPLILILSVVILPLCLFLIRRLCTNGTVSRHNHSPPTTASCSLWSRFASGDWLPRWPSFSKTVVLLMVVPPANPVESDREHHLTDSPQTPASAETTTTLSYVNTRHRSARCKTTG